MSVEEFKGQHYRLLCAPSLEPTDLDSYEKAHSEKRKIDSDRQLSAAAMSLAHRLGSGPIRHDTKGKPLAAIELSLSHKDGWVVAATVENTFVIGADVENPSALKDPVRFARRALALSERANLNKYVQLWKCSERDAISALWALKECFFKATGFDPGPAQTEFSTGGIIIGGGREYPLVESFVQIQSDRVLCALIFSRRDL